MKQKISEKMDELIETYIKKGVFRNKIIITKYPAICSWSLTRKCLVNENNVETLELIDNVLTYKNNRIITLIVRSELTNDDINEINNSDGIIITDALYGKPYFRYGFIPIN